MNPLIEVIASADDAIRNRSLDAVLRGASLEQLLQHCQSLDCFRRDSTNLYHRVRAFFFLSALHRYHLPPKLPKVNLGRIPVDGFHHLLGRRFAEAIDVFLGEQTRTGPNDAISSALAKTYHSAGIQTLADQVRRSVRMVRGNQWMFRVGHPDDHPLRIRRELLKRSPATNSFPLLKEQTPVRMDFSHSAWSDIFFLGMDFPEGARVLNASVDLGVHGRDDSPQPPIQTFLRVIEEPVLRLTSIDLGATDDITQIPQVFDFARDYLGLLKAAVIAAGLVPPGVEGCEQPIGALLSRLVGPGLGLELVTHVNDIPKGSRLAVSTNLLGSLISVSMRATSQVSTLSGSLSEQDRRIVAARAILGEWLGGSGGGWQDSGGIWPGIKLIEGATSSEGDPEYGISRGRLLPNHRILDGQEVGATTRQKLQESLVLVHGGMAQNVGPILEMVTEKYLLRTAAEWEARKAAVRVLDRIVQALRDGDIERVGQETTKNFTGPLQTIIPWATNRFTDALIEKSRAQFGKQFWGFWMLGGMAGGGMGFLFDPRVKNQAQEWLQTCMIETKEDLQNALPFAIDPLVYNFSINDRGTDASLLRAEDAVLPDKYYALLVPRWLRAETRSLSPTIRRELDRLGRVCEGDSGSSRTARLLVQSMLPQPLHSETDQKSLDELLAESGFDEQQHEQVRSDLRAGRIGLAQNRLPATVLIEDAEANDVVDLRAFRSEHDLKAGREAIGEGRVAVVTLAAGVGSRWSQGAGVVKALHPFCKLDGQHRNFLEIHLAKTCKTSRTFGVTVPHVFTTGYLTDAPIRRYLAKGCWPGSVFVSTGRSVGLRMIPMVRDLRFAWEELPQQILDEQQEKVRESSRGALIEWARQMGEAEDYTDNTPMQCLHPVGHWYELPNMLLNGTLRMLLERHPAVTQLLLHNIDTLGAHVDPAILGRHILSRSTLSFEVIARRLEDRGGGLARVGGKTRLVEGLAMPDEDAELRLSFYNSMTTWIDIDRTLDAFGLSRSDLYHPQVVEKSVRRMAQRLPTYVTLKDVKKRWGHGQEDVFPIAQFEKLWGDMSALPDVECSYFAVPLARGQQLKDQSQLDGWLRDGSAEHVRALCSWA